MAGLFDDLEQAAPQQAPAGGLFDDLEAAVQPPAAVPHAGINSWLPQPLQGIANRLDDVGTGIEKGMIGAAESAVGLANILSGGAAGNALERHAGWNPEAAKQKAESFATPQHRAAQEELRQAQGFAGTLAAIGRNPSIIVDALAQSAPSMMLGGLVGRGVGAGAQLLGRSAPVLAPAIGEGVVSAGQAAENIRQQTGNLSAGGTAAAVGTGALTGLLGAAGAAAGRALGVADVDALLSGQGGAGAARGLVNRVLKGAGLESLEEMSQSSQEQVLQNLATGKPLMQGVGQSTAMGAVTGGVMGGAAGARQPRVGELMDQRAAEVAKNSGTFGQVYQQVKQNEAALQGAQPDAQSAAAPAQPVPFAGSADIAPLLDRLEIAGPQREQAMQLLAPSESHIEQQRRGVITNADRDMLAQAIGLQGAEQLAFSRRIGETFNSEQTVAVLDAVRQRWSNLLEQQARIVSGTASDIERAQFVQNVHDATELFGSIAGARAEAGRSMAAYRRIGSLAEAQAVLESVSGARGADDLAQAIGKAMQAGGIAKAAQVAKDSRSWQHTVFGDYLRAAWLSSPKTHLANILGNVGMQVDDVANRFIAAGIAKAKAPIRKLANAAGADPAWLKSETEVREAVELFLGQLASQGKAFRAAGDAFMSGESALLGGEAKAEGNRQLGRLALGPDDTAQMLWQAGEKGKAAVHHAGQAADTIWRLPFRALTAEDGYFATIAYNSELHALAARQAVQERRAGQLPASKTISQRVQEIIANAPPSMIEQAGQHARGQTFNDRAGATMQLIQLLKNRHPWTNAIVPFVATPTRVIRAALLRSPAAALFPSFRADVLAGGARQERALSKVLWGTGIMLAAGMLAESGDITGAGPESEKERKALMATGWRPYSIRLPDGSYVGFGRLDPFASLLGVAADASTTDMDAKTLAEKVMFFLGSLSENITQKSWLVGLNDFLGFLSDPRRNAAWYAQRQAGSMLQPWSILSHAGGAMDPYQRAPEGFTESIVARQMFGRDMLPPKLSPWGEPVANDAQGWPSLLVPGQVGKPTSDPVLVEAAELGFVPAVPSDKLTVNGQQHELDRQQHIVYRQLQGQMMHALLGKAMANRQWRRLTKDQKLDALGKLQRQARAAVRTAMIPYVTRGDRRAVDRLAQRIGQLRETRR